MLGKLLIAAMFVVWMWTLCIFASLVGWWVWLVFAAALPFAVLAECYPERWGWLFGRKPPSNPDA